MPAKKTKRDIRIARKTFAAGPYRTVREGDILLADDDIVRKHPGAFDTPDEYGERLERMTARPGERRNVEVPNG